MYKILITHLKYFQHLTLHRYKHARQRIYELKTPPTKRYITYCDRRSHFCASCRRRISLFSCYSSATSSMQTTCANQAFRK